MVAVVEEKKIMKDMSFTAVTKQDPKIDDKKAIR
jgi:hypothetical protein